MRVHADGFVGRLIITWPKADPPAVRGFAVTLTDADTGEQIATALEMDLTVHADPGSIVTAEMTMLTDADGQPLAANAKPLIADDGENVATGRFRWLIAEMRIAE